jgi:hypothetical protein
MKWLRIEFGGEPLDLLPVDHEPPGAKGLTHGEVLEISYDHWCDLFAGGGFG